MKKEINIDNSIKDIKQIKYKTKLRETKKTRRYFILSTKYSHTLNQ